MPTKASRSADAESLPALPLSSTATSRSRVVGAVIPAEKA